MDFPGLKMPKLSCKNAKTLKVKYKQDFTTNLIQNQDVAKCNTLYKFVNLDDKKFSEFKKLKKKQQRMGRKLKPILKLTNSGVGKF